MPFIKEILDCNSISVVGMGKNTGKTECLNYILSRIPSIGRTVAVTSVGVDGEDRDIVTGTSKPEIVLKTGTIFATSEKHYRARRITSELLDISYRETSLGRVITARALSDGKSKLSGHPTTESLSRWIKGVILDYEVDLAIIDGALSRVSIASPAITQGLLLATGAALSVSMDSLVLKTAYMVALINLQKSTFNFIDDDNLPKRGVWMVDNTDSLHLLSEGGAFLMDTYHPQKIKDAKALLVTGALTDRFLNRVRTVCLDNDIEIVVRDFTKIFISRLNFNLFVKAGGRITVINRSKLIAVCANPVSPDGFVFDSAGLCNRLSESLKLPVYDIRKIDSEV